MSLTMNYSILLLLFQVCDRSCASPILTRSFSLERKNDFVLCSVLANICRRMMETVSVLPFGKFRENRKREMMIFISQASYNPMKA